MLFIHLLGVNSLYIHLRNIALISLAHLIEPSNQVIPLLSQISQLGIQIQLLLSILHLSVSQMIQLRVKISETEGCLLMILL